MEKVDDWELPKVPAKYVKELQDAGKYSEAAKYKVDYGHLRMQKRLFIEHDLSGDTANFDKVEDRVKTEYMKIIQGLAELERKARSAAYVGRDRDIDTPVFDDVAEKYKDLEFLRDDKGRFTEVVSGWYQNANGDLFHYDGVVWDKVPDEKIVELEYLG